MKHFSRIFNLKRFWDTERDMLCLYVGLFFQTFVLGIWFLAMPFIIKRLNGSDFEVGLYGGLYFGGYVVALAVSLLSRYTLDRINPKRLVMCGTGVVVGMITGIYLTIVAAESGLCSNNVAISIISVLSAIQGLMTVTIWPPAMAWVSSSHEGSRLNRRLGIYNMAWSLASVAGPFIGGYLVEVNSTLPLISCIIIAVLSFVMICFAGKPGDVEKASDKPAKLNDGKNALLHWRFMWMSRIALFTHFVCGGVVFFQLALLFRYNLGFSESNFGAAITVTCGAIFFMFWVLGKTGVWHYRPSVFFGAQIVLLLSMILILNGSVLWVFFLASGLIGFGRAVLYTSHLYYTISGVSARVGKMVIHEIVLSIGFVAGAVAGGYLSENFGRYTPYWFGFGTVVAGLLVQGLIWFLAGLKRTDQQVQ